MQQLDWYNQNANRAYPFKGIPSVGAQELPDEVFLDAGFMLGPAAAPELGADIYLQSVVRLNDAFTFTFASEATAGIAFVFMAQADTYGTTLLVDDSRGSDYGSAFLTVGNFAALAELFANGTYTYSLAAANRVEEGVVQNLSRSKVLSISLANDPDPLFFTPGAESSSSYEHPIAVPRAQGLTGEVLFRAGYNMALFLAEADNSLTFLASPGAGEGEPCEDVWRESSTPDTCKCADLIYTISGQEPDSTGGFHLAGGQGVSIIANAAAHKLTLVFNSGVVLRGCEVGT